MQAAEALPGPLEVGGKRACVPSPQIPEGEPPARDWQAAPCPQEGRWESGWIHGSPPCGTRVGVRIDMSALGVLLA